LQLDWLASPVALHLLWGIFRESGYPLAFSLRYRDYEYTGSMATKVQRPPTWAEVGIRNSNFRTTLRGLRFAMAWGLATAELGREPGSVEEYAETMEESRATAFRAQQAFREAFPTEVTPYRMNKTSGAQDRYDDLWKQLVEIGKRKRTDKAKLMIEAQPTMFLVGSTTAAA